MLLIYPIHTVILFLFSIFLSYKIYMLTPVDTANKRISEQNKKRYKEKAKIIITFWIFASCITLILGLFDLSFSISMGISFVYVLMNF